LQIPGGNPMQVNRHNLIRTVLMLLLALGVIASSVAYQDPTQTISAQRRGKKGKGAEAAAATLDLPSELRPGREAQFGPSAPVPSLFPGYIVSGDRKLGQAPADTKSLRIADFVSEREYGPGLSRLRSLEVLEIESAWGWEKEMSEAIAAVSGLRELSMQSVGNNQGDTDILEPLAKLKNLERLEIGVGNALLQGIIEVATQLPKLKVLHLRHSGGAGNQQVARGLDGIGKLSGLHTLSLIGGILAASTLEEVAGLSSLRALWLNHSTISGGAFPHIAKLSRQLELLSLAYVRTPDVVSFAIEGEEIPEGAEPPALRELDMYYFMPTRGMDSETISTLAQFTSLEVLRLGRGIELEPDSVPVKPDSPLDPESLMHLSSLTQLRELDLSLQSVTSAVIDKLAESLTSLETLSLAGGLPEHLTPAAIASLAKFPKLKSLDLSCNVLSQEHADKIVELKHLTSLNLEFCKGVNDDFCKALANSKSIEVVNLKATEITKQAVDYIAGLSELRALNIADCEKCDVSRWPRTPKLEVLWLDQCGIRESGLPNRRTAPKLTAISMRGTFMRQTPDGYYTSRFDPMPGVTGKGLASVFAHVGLLYIDITGVLATTEQMRGISALRSVIWMQLPVDPMISGGAVVTNPLGPNRFTTLKRLHVETFAPSSYGDFNDPTMMALRTLEQNLNQAYPHAVVTTLFRPDPWSKR
jgi:Leucine-rich repeat (LRR) protein